MTGGDGQALATLVRESAAAGIARDVLHVGLGAMPAQHRQPHHRMLVEEALAPALGPSRGRLFTLANGDLVAVAPPGGPHLAAARAGLAALFGGLAEPPLLALRRLPAAAAALLVAIETSLTPPPTPAGQPAARSGSFPSTELAAVERALVGASLDRFIRRSSVWRLAPGAAEPTLLWPEVTLDAAALQAALLPGYDPDAAPALAARLRRVMDRRLLAELAAPREATRLPPAGLSLAIGSLGEPAFRRLDEALGAAGRARIVLWFAAAELLAAAADWGFVRAFAAARGYQLGLDVPGPETAALLPPARSGVVLVRFRWRPDLPPPTQALPPTLPAERVILTGVDRAAAVGWGWEAGIAAFEGRLLAGRAEG